MSDESLGCLSKLIGFVVGGMIVFVILMVTQGCAENKVIEVQNPETKVIEEVEFRCFGLIDRSKYENPTIEYKIVVGNIVWSILLSETIIAPIYLLGYCLYEPVGVKSTNKSYYKGSVGYKPKDSSGFKVKIDVDY